MRIHHIAIWVKELERMKDFYCEHFQGIASDIYHNPANQYKSYFLTLRGGTQIEIYHKPGFSYDKVEKNRGYMHIAISTGSREQVVDLTEKLRANDIKVLSEPRETGDRYFESVIEDPEGNTIELTI